MRVCEIARAEHGRMHLMACLAVRALLLPTPSIRAPESLRIKEQARGVRPGRWAVTRVRGAAAYGHGAVAATKTSVAEHRPVEASASRLRASLPHTNGQYLRVSLPALLWGNPRAALRRAQKPRTRAPKAALCSQTEAGERDGRRQERGSGARELHRGRGKREQAGT